MKKIFSAALLLLFLAASAAAQDISSQVKEMDLVKKFLVEVNAKFIEARDLGSVYEIVIEQTSKKGILYATKDGKYIILGSLLDKDKNNITRDRFNELNKIEFSQLPIQDAILIKKGNGSKKLVMFTDVDCPFCKKAHNWLKEQSDYSLYVFLLPLPIHPNAQEKSIKVLCSENKAEALDNAKNDKEISGAKCSAGEDVLKKHMALANSFNITGTPLFITETGQKIEGFNQQTLEEYLKK
jgi:thiol:disulfide interchange protein DsbC